MIRTETLCRLVLITLLMSCGNSEDGKSENAPEPTPDTSTPEPTDISEASDTTSVPDGQGQRSDSSGPSDDLSQETNQPPGDGNEGTPEPGQFGAPCTGNDTCESGYCVEGQQGFICTKTCVSECPEGFSCMGVGTGSDVIFLCIPAVKKLCTPCTESLNCNGGACLTIDGIGQCASSCTTDTDCPSDFDCLEAAEQPGLWCQPSSGSCTCTSLATGAQQSCQASNNKGTCYGIETCEGELGWTGCTAAEPSEESCDGVDNDCDGLIDEELDNGTACEISVEGVGVCNGVQTCFGPQGWICQGQTPEEEVCDFKDNDCDGEVDEDFKTGEFYGSDEHCGTCFASCKNALPNAQVIGCAVLGGQPQCVVELCLPGYTKINEFQCVSQSTSNCLPCATDDNCAGDDAACVELTDGNFCGTACDPTAANNCPLGFLCQDVGAPSPQCIPASGSCTCDGTNTDISRACSVTYTPDDLTQPAYTCNGTEQCTATGWGDCNLPEEACDGVDNNCDGLIDETFLNNAGQYGLVEHCGGCNISCLALAVPNAVPSCDTTTAIPTCDYACKAGYVDVNGLTGDGCECLPSPGADLAGDGLDTNCDGIDGDKSQGIFVAKNGSDLAAGTYDSPVLTIGTGLERAATFAKRDVYVATGVYSENIALVDGVGLFGGYSSDFAQHDALLFETALIGGEPTDLLPGTVTASGLGLAGAMADTVLDGFTIFGSTAGNLPGQNSYAIYLRDCGSQLRVRNNRVFGGAGGVGLGGFSGDDGAEGTPGKTGKSSYDVNKFTANDNRYCTPGDELSGGKGGQLSCSGNTDVSGGKGGRAECPEFEVAPLQGGQQGQGPAGGAGGNAGWALQIDTTSSCTFCGVLPGQATTGELGTPGSTGESGQAGVGCAGNGSIVDGHWVGESGGTGNPGIHGSGGGGGGAGGGVDVQGQFCIDEAAGIDIAGSGGGGGSGGCRGTGGQGGLAGGGSFGIFVVYTTPAPSIPEITDNTLRRGAGGAGGAGGSGGAGGNGGAGAPGGQSGEETFQTLCARPGASGAGGGTGGHGGGGGGGCGGASYNVFIDLGGASIPLNNIEPKNSFVPGADSGPGGAGGTSPGQSGSPGADGPSDDTNF